MYGYCYACMFCCVYVLMCLRYLYVCVSVSMNECGNILHACMYGCVVNAIPL